MYGSRSLEVVSYEISCRPLSQRERWCWRARGGGVRLWQLPVQQPWIEDGSESNAELVHHLQVESILAGNS